MTKKQTLGSKATKADTLHKGKTSDALVQFLKAIKASDNENIGIDSIYDALPLLQGHLECQGLEDVPDMLDLLNKGEITGNDFMDFMRNVKVLQDVDTSTPVVENKNKTPKRIEQYRSVSVDDLRDYNEREYTQTNYQPPYMHAVRTHGRSIVGDSHARQLSAMLKSVKNPSPYAKPLDMKPFEHSSKKQHSTPKKKKADSKSYSLTTISQIYSKNSASVFTHSTHSRKGSLQHGDYNPPGGLNATKPQLALRGPNSNQSSLDKSLSRLSDDTTSVRKNRSRTTSPKKDQSSTVMSRKSKSSSKKGTVSFLTTASESGTEYEISATDVTSDGAYTPTGASLGSLTSDTTKYEELRNNERVARYRRSRRKYKRVRKSDNNVFINYQGKESDSVTSRDSYLVKRQSRKERQRQKKTNYQSYFHLKRRCAAYDVGKSYTSLTNSGMQLPKKVFSKAEIAYRALNVIREMNKSSYNAVWQELCEAATTEYYRVTRYHRALRNMMIWCRHYAKWVGTTGMQGNFRLAYITYFPFSGHKIFPVGCWRPTGCYSNISGAKCRNELNWFSSKKLIIPKVKF